MKTLEQFITRAEANGFVEGWGKEMFDAQSQLKIGKHDRIPFGSGEVSTDDKEYAEERTLCHDCGVIAGELHVFGCDSETCPECKGQAFCCDCSSK